MWPITKPKRTTPVTAITTFLPIVEEMSVVARAAAGDAREGVLTKLNYIPAARGLAMRAAIVFSMMRAARAAADSSVSSCPSGRPIGALSA